MTDQTLSAWVCRARTKHQAAHGGQVAVGSGQVQRGAAVEVAVVRLHPAARQHLLYLRADGSQGPWGTVDCRLPPPRGLLTPPPPARC